MPDDTDVAVTWTCIDILQPSARVICVVVLGALKILLFTEELPIEDTNFQDGLVQSKINAAWIHSENLLDKHCPTFDQNVCRCREQSNGRGQGCGWIDTNCNVTLSTDTFRALITLKSIVLFV
jgi:hypothetical protein